MKRLITRSSIFFAGAVFGLIIGLLISQVVIFTTIGAAVYNARVDQYEMDKFQAWLRLHSKPYQDFKETKIGL